MKERLKEKINFLERLDDLLRDYIERSTLDITEQSKIIDTYILLQEEIRRKYIAYEYK